MKKESKLKLYKFDLISLDNVQNKIYKQIKNFIEKI